MPCTEWRSSSLQNGSSWQQVQRQRSERAAAAADQVAMAVDLAPAAWVAAVSAADWAAPAAAACRSHRAAAECWTNCCCCVSVNHSVSYMVGGTSGSVGSTVEGALGDEAKRGCGVPLYRRLLAHAGGAGRDERSGSAACGGIGRSNQRARGNKIGDGARVGEPAGWHGWQAMAWLRPGEGGGGGGYVRVVRLEKVQVGRRTELECV